MSRLVWDLQDLLCRRGDGGDGARAVGGPEGGDQRADAAHAQLSSAVGEHARTVRGRVCAGAAPCCHFTAHPR